MKIFFLKSALVSWALETLMGRGLSTMPLLMSLGDVFLMLTSGFLMENLWSSRARRCSGVR